MKLKNLYLIEAVNFLQGLKLKPSDSRNRTKLVNVLSEAVTALQTDERALMDDHLQKDKKGEFKRDGDKYVFKTPADITEFNREHADLMNETVEIDSTMFHDKIQKVKPVLEAYDGELSGKEADVYDALLDAFEEEGAK